MKNDLVAALTLLVAAIAPAGQSGAASRSVQSCVVSVTPLRFGVYDPRDPTGSMMTGSVIFNCALSQPVAIYMDHGHGPASGPREMEGAGDVPYNIYFDPAATRIWGDGTGGTDYYSNPAPPPGTNVVIPFFGRIFKPRTPVKAGAFTDTIVVRMSY
ncbi:MAG TPA: spore coat U domain-containing protein [Stellaceae bacterium]|nr:spore coat U domain-containing protein [Stellaceae bacterium]